MKKKQLDIKFFIAIIITIALLSFFEVKVISSIGLLAVIYIGNKFLNELGTSIPIFELILFVSGFQWIIGPFFLYRTEPNLMYVPEQEYMFITVIAYLCFVFGCLFFQKEKAHLDKNRIQTVLSRPKVISILKKIYWIGLFSFIVSLIFDSSLNFIFIILYSFSFIAAIMLLYTPLLNKLFYVIFIYFLLFFKGVYEVIFAEFISQCFLLIIFIPNIYSLSKKKVIVLLSLGILMLSVLNTAKTAYREKMWLDSGARNVEMSFFFKILFNSDATNKASSDSFFYRISSGSVNSDIFNNVPRSIQHTNGEVLLEDFVNAIIPRFLYPEKKDIDTRKNYMLYTGKYLDENTSVGVNALGIGYAEFGILGCFVFMFLYGFFLSNLFNFFVRNSKRNVLYLFYIILVFIGATKAEIEFVGNVNSIIKILIFVLLFIYIISKNKTNLFAYGHRH